MNCPICGTSGVYVGLHSLECANPGCTNYDRKSTPLVRAAWVQVQGAGITSMYWAVEDLRVHTEKQQGDLVTMLDPSTVRKALPGEPIVGVCIHCQYYKTQDEAINAFREAFQVW